MRLALARSPPTAEGCTPSFVPPNDWPTPYTQEQQKEKRGPIKTIGGNVTWL